MRDVTERPEAIEAGTVKLVGANKKKIVTEVSFILENESEYNTMSEAHNPYGNGDTSKIIVDLIKREFNAN